MNTTIFCCPICGGAFALADRSAVCPSGHAFDRAKEGYYNLLLRAGAGTHGDNREMVLARREFLTHGYYDFLADRVSELAVRYLEDGGAVLDCGAGEGYYTERVREALERRGRVHTVYGFDISKDAVRYAAKRYAGLSLAVASAYHVPVLSGSVSLLLNMFAPVCREEYLRVLSRDGIFLMAIPEREHLYGLKAAIYNTPYKNEVAPYEIEGFTLLHTEQVRRTVTLTGGDIQALFAMTPYAYRTSEEGRARVAALERLTTDFHFRLFVYRRSPSKKA